MGPSLEIIDCIHSTYGSSGPLSGYDTGVISGALVSIGSDLGPAELSSGQKVSVLFTDDTEYVAEAEEAAVFRNS